MRLRTRCPSQCCVIELPSESVIGGGRVHDIDLHLFLGYTLGVNKGIEVPRKFA